MNAIRAARDRKQMGFAATARRKFQKFSMHVKILFDSVQDLSSYMAGPPLRRSGDFGHAGSARFVQWLSGPSGRR
jgi:hypothetical protein